MPYTQAHKESSRQRILESAAKLFTRKGYEQTSIDQVMTEAKLTRGAFYAHFRSKQDLYAQAIANTPEFSQLTAPKPDELSNQKWLRYLVNGYLHQDHVDEAETPCPLAFLVSDVALREPEARAVYTDVYRKMNTLIRAYTRGDSQIDKETVLAVTAMMIGGVAVARTLDNDKLRRQLLQSCRQAALGLLGAE